MYFKGEAMKTGKGPSGTEIVNPLADAVAVVFKIVRGGDTTGYLTVFYTAVCNAGAEGAADPDPLAS
jgi:hypothetical protein